MRKLVIALVIGIIIGQMFPLGTIFALQAIPKMSTRSFPVKFQIINRDTRRPLAGNFTVVAHSLRPHTFRIVASGVATAETDGIVTTWAQASCSPPINRVIELVAPLLK